MLSLAAAAVGTLYTSDGRPLGTITLDDNPPPLPPFPPPAPAPVGDHVFPRRIFSYWDSKEYPELVAACFAAMRAFNPGYVVTILDASANSFFPLPVPRSGPPLTTQQRADWYRINALAEFGGIWMDATSISLQSVEHWVNTSALQLQGFNMPANALLPGETIMENWAMASPKNCTFTKRWRDIFRTALETGAEAFVDAQDPALLGSLINNSYLDQHVAWVLTRAALPHEPYSLLSSTDYGRPFYYQVEHAQPNGAWDSCLSAGSVLSEPPPPSTAFIKFRGAERGCVAPLWLYGGDGVAALLARLLQDYPDLSSASTQPPMTAAAYFTWWRIHYGVAIWLSFLLAMLCAMTCAACYWDGVTRAMQSRGFCLPSSRAETKSLQVP
ncbi:hypothetical protein AB1Y20_006290 [Prymnesium parvum]|uniref:Nucleotide-diphospho-sugar transferase domain-containing protein n=1 Tax=Prymnesium parvum TaxID=97485 RepID=A0AB34J5I3_PRYPA